MPERNIFIINCREKADHYIDPDAYDVVGSFSGTRRLEVTCQITHEQTTLRVVFENGIPRYSVCGLTKCMHNKGKPVEASDPDVADTSTQEPHYI